MQEQALIFDRQGQLSSSMVSLCHEIGIDPNELYPNQSMMEEQSQGFGLISSNVQEKMKEISEFHRKHKLKVLKKMLQEQHYQSGTTSRTRTRIQQISSDERGGGSVQPAAKRRDEQTNTQRVYRNGAVRQSDNLATLTRRQQPNIDGSGGNQDLKQFYRRGIDSQLRTKTVQNVSIGGDDKNSTENMSKSPSSLFYSNKQSHQNNTKKIGWFAEEPRSRAESTKIERVKDTRTNSIYDTRTENQTHVTNSSENLAGIGIVTTAANSTVHPRHDRSQSQHFSSRLEFDYKLRMVRKMMRLERNERASFEQHQKAMEEEQEVAEREKKKQEAIIYQTRMKRVRQIKLERLQAERNAKKAEVLEKIKLAQRENEKSRLRQRRLYEDEILEKERQEKEEMQEEVKHNYERFLSRQKDRTERHEQRRQKEDAEVQQAHRQLLTLEQQLEKSAEKHEKQMHSRQKETQKKLNYWMQKAKDHLEENQERFNDKSLRLIERIISKSPDARITKDRELLQRHIKNQQEKYKSVLEGAREKIQQISLERKKKHEELLEMQEQKSQKAIENKQKLQMQQVTQIRELNDLKKTQVEENRVIQNYLHMNGKEKIVQLLSEKQRKAQEQKYKFIELAHLSGKGVNEAFLELKRRGHSFEDLAREEDKQLKEAYDQKQKKARIQAARHITNIMNINKALKQDIIGH